MIPVHKLIALFQRMYREHWAYKWGSASQGCVDCVGAFVWAYRQFGQSIYHGSNRIARSYVKELLPISQAQPGMAVFKLRKPGQQYYDLPAEYRQGGARYNGDLNDYYHIGLVDTDPAFVLNAQSAKTGFVRSRITQNWACCGELKAVEYGGEETEMQYTVIGGTLNLRERPDKNAPILARIPNGTVVTVTEYGDTWCRVEYEGKTGWCMSRYLRKPEVDGGWLTSVRTQIDLARKALEKADALLADMEKEETQ